MARVGRLAGALLAETGGTYYLVGHTKLPCDWGASGFAPPPSTDGVIGPGVAPVAQLVRISDIVDPLVPPVVELAVEGAPLGRLLAEIFVIARTGLVSERLWRLVTGETDEHDTPPPDVIPARWLGELPPAVWQIVRDSVLRCT